MREDEIREADGRFRKGVCPNPKGRPRKAKTVGEAILKAANETVTANANGRKRRMRKIEATAVQVANQGMQGDLRAGKLLLDYAARAEEQRDSAGAAGPRLMQSDLEIVEDFLARYRRSIGVEDQPC